MDDNRTMSTMDWFFTLLVLAIPVVNIILYIVWACGAGNRNRVNFCRASLLWVLLAGIFYLLLFGLMGVGAGLQSL